MIYKKQAFTLVELIVVIIILAILWTIAFISLQWYSRDSRNAVRISDISNTKLALELFYQKTWKYPIPDNNFQITNGSWVILWNQWIFGESVLQNVEIISQVPKDPLTDKNMWYSTTLQRQEFQVKYYMEWDADLYYTQNTYAADDSTPYITWDYNWLFLVWDNGAYFSIPSLFLGWLEDSVDQGGTFVLEENSTNSFILSHLIINHDYGPLLNSSWEPITLWNIWLNYLDFILALQDMYESMLWEPYDWLLWIDTTDWDAVNNFINAAWWDPDCDEWYHVEWHICVKNYTQTACVAAWKPLANSKYYSSQVTVIWEDGARSAPTNCNWACINWYGWPDCTIAPTWNITDTWGSCSAECGWGTQNKIVECLNNEWIPVSWSYCETHATEPVVTQVCNTQLCVYDWKCWTAARVYPYSSYNYWSYSHCSIWSVTGWWTPSFPAINGTSTWTCDWVNGWSVSATCEASRTPNVIAWACWSANTTVKFSTTSFDWLTFCSSWFFASSSFPVFPEIWWSVSWNCNGLNDWWNASCTLTRDWVHGMCWSNSQTYIFSDTDYWTGSTFCSQWTITGWWTPSFPEIEQQVEWTCDWIDQWDPSWPCVANRTQQVINWVCWSAHNKTYTYDTVSYGTDEFCSFWNTNPESPDFPEIWEVINWSCVWMNGWPTAWCSATRSYQPINWACWTANGKQYSYDSSTYWSDTFCTSGTTSPSTPDFPALWDTATWSCIWQHDGTTASCSAERFSAPVPAPPVDAWATDIWQRTITRNWVLEPSVDYYEFRTDVTEDWQSTASFTETNKVEETWLYCSFSYEWRQVRACNSIWCSEVTILGTTSTLWCPAPTPQAATNITQDNITWNRLNDVEWITNYEVSIDAWSNRSSTLWWESQTSVNVSWYNCWTTYYFDIRSCSPDGCWTEDTMNATTSACTYANGSSCSDQLLTRDVCIYECEQIYWVWSPTCDFQWLAWNVQFSQLFCYFPSGYLPIDVTWGVCDLP